MKKKKLLYCFIISIIFLLICTKSSPLYKINDWYDANAFFTMGKALFNSKVPYLDLFEQKGIILYFLYGLASIISSNSFIGVFILEVISNTIFFYYASKICDIYLKDKYSYIIIPILAVMILSSRSFTHGGSCEELTFPMIIITVYYFINYLKNDNISNKATYLIGILASCIFWMKYTLLGFHIGFCLILLFKKLKNKDYKDLFTKIFYFLLGFITISIPILIYFIINNGFNSLIDVYFLFNINNYANQKNIFGKIVDCLNILKGVSIKYYQYLLLIIIPMLISIKTKYYFDKKSNNILLFLAMFSLYFFLFIGGTNFRYYSLPMQPLMVFGLIYIFDIIGKTKLDRFLISNLVIILTIAVTLIISYYRSPSTEYLSKDKNYYAQYVFSSLIEEDSSILNFGFLDGGFYFTTNTIPDYYYFEKNNIDSEIFLDNIESQREYIRKKQPDYIITKNELEDSDKELIEENYTLIKTHKQKYEGKEVTYSLYKINSVLY